MPQAHGNEGIRLRRPLHPALSGHLLPLMEKGFCGNGMPPSPTQAGATSVGCRAPDTFGVTFSVDL